MRAFLNIPSKFLLLLILLTFCELGFSQRKKDKKSETPTSELSLEAEYYFIEGMKFFILEEYNQALGRFRMALDLAPDYAGIYFQLAETNARLGNSGKALEYAQEALSLAPDNPFNYDLVARIHGNRGDINKGIKAYESLIENIPDSEKYYENIALFYLALEKPNKAIDNYNLWEATVGLQENILLQKQRIYLENGDLEGAIVEGKKLVSIIPEPMYILGLAEMLIESEQAEEAANYLEPLVLEGNPDAQATLARIQMDTGENQGEALSDLETLIQDDGIAVSQKIELIQNYWQKNPNQLESVVSLTTLLTEQNSTESLAFILHAEVLISNQQLLDAQQAYQQVVLLDEGNLEVWLTLLALENDLFLGESLKTHAEIALEIYPNYAEFWIYAIRGYLLTNDLTMANLMLQDGQRYAGNKEDLLQAFEVCEADILTAQEDFKTAEELYQKVLSKNKSDRNALKGYVLLNLKQNNKLSDAKQMAEELLTQRPEYPPYVDILALVEYTQGNYDIAKNQLEKIVSKNPTGRILEHYGDVLYQLGDIEAAVKQWRAAKAQGNGISLLLDKKIDEEKIYE